MCSAARVDGAAQRYRQKQILQWASFSTFVGVFLPDSVKMAAKSPAIVDAFQIEMRRKEKGQKACVNFPI